MDQDNLTFEVLFLDGNLDDFIELKKYFFLGSICVLLFYVWPRDYLENVSTEVGRTHFP